MDSVEETFSIQKSTRLGGWLGFFTVGMYVLGALAFLDMILAATHQIRIAGGSSSAWTIVWIEAISLAFSILAIFVAVSLSKRKRSSITYSKMFLIFFALERFVTRFLLKRPKYEITSYGPNPHTVILNGHDWVSVATIIVLPAIWFLYFQKSERVKRTLTR